jgi:subtilisin family serine protease
MHRSASRPSFARILSVIAGTTLGLTGVIAEATTSPAAPVEAVGNGNTTPVVPPGLSRGDLVEGRYMITFPDTLPAAARAAVVARLTASGATVQREFSETFDGIVVDFNGPLSAPQRAIVNRLKRDGEASRVEQDQVVENTITAPAATQTSAPWGLDRIDQATGTDGTYTDRGTGAGVRVYVVDTGVSAHNDLSGRISSGFNAMVDQPSTDTTDGNGHGTHVAGTIAGTTHGVAKGATIVPVRVLDDNGAGTSSSVIAGLDWILANHPTGTPGVVNMSLGGGASSSLDAAVTRLIDSGFVVAVAAGNSNLDACNASPARVPGAVTVGATTTADARASYSNFGTCLDMFAPGSGVLSSWYTSATATQTLSGTSMATPHVAGAAAVLWGADTALSARTITEAVINSVTPGIVTSAGTGSPANLLHLAPPAATPVPSPTPSPSPGSPSSPTAPAAPTGVSATITNDRATISWSAPSSDGGATITSYQVNGSTTGSCTWLSGPLSCTIRDLPGGEHTFTVTATNSAGTSVASSPSNTVTSTPSNDYFGNARRLDGRSGRVTDDNRRATIEDGEPGSGDGTRQSTMWYVLTAPATGVLSIDTEESTFDTVLEVFEGPTIESLSLKAANDDHELGDGTFSLTSAVEWDVARGQVIYVRVSSFDGSIGDVIVNWNLTEDPVTVQSLAPNRLIDTRSGIGGVAASRVGALNGGGTPLSISVLDRAGIPASGVEAVSMNVTVTDTVANAFGGYVTVHPCGSTVPNASNLNFTTGQTVANAVTVPVSATGTICVSVYGLANVIIDVNGAVLSDSGFTAISPVRRADTRSGIGGVASAPVSGNTILRVPMLGRAGIPSSGVAAVSMNVTATNTVAPDEGGFVTVYPCDGTVPNVSNINFVTGQTVPNAVTAPLSADGELCVSVYGRADIIIDVNGVYTSDAEFGAVSPNRITDTRQDSTPVIGALDGSDDDLVVAVTGRGGVPATGVSAVAINVTVTGTQAGGYGGYVTVYPCDSDLPNVSTLNFTSGQTVANAAIAPLSVDGELCVHVFGRASVIIDVNGWIAG